MSAPPFYECYNQYDVDAAWFAVYDKEGVRQSLRISQGNNGAEFRGIQVDQVNGSVHVHLSTDQSNNNCNSGSTSWNWNGSTLADEDEATVITNSLGEPISIIAVSYTHLTLPTIYSV